MATRVWRGTAADITQRDTLTVAGTWATSDTATITINGNDIVVTVGSDTTTAQVADIISRAINATSRTDNLGNDESRNIGGQEIPEFTEVTATVSSSVVTVTANTAGEDFTMTATESTAGTGTVTQATAQAATGKTFFDNADNWSGGVVPASTDTIVFTDNATNCTHGLDQTAKTGTVLQIDASYTGTIGLPSQNANGYSEYRTRHLGINTASTARSVVIGDGTGSGSTRINLDVDTSNPKIVVISTGAQATDTVGAVDIIGGGATTELSVRSGVVSVAADSRDSATLNVLEVAYQSQITSDAAVILGSTATVTTVTKTGGSLSLVNTPSSLTITSLTNRNGTVDVNGQAACTTLTIEGGAVYWNSTGTITTAVLSGTGALDMSRDNTAKTITNPIERYSDASAVIDPNKVIGSLVIDNNRISDLSGLDLGSDIRITRGATA